ncbi:tyrosine-type recombinase/integrase [Haliangium sp. UPWRP_2]|uniref:tyrosine-type recombinase/integrase n=1 Tax=Haliangium sp. UPWRP_2 TaxID=1931276 RepID=UPI001304EAED|nr:tyrosine-type recombinase/integrase [Haliangium sp. UPWRP_2]HNN98480.1 tyrosine-type recombinase/integrase [Pseudomonadota bacterium]
MGEVIRRTKNGKFLGFYLRYYEAGRRKQIASKQPSAAEARRMLVQIEARIARGEAGIAEKPQPSPTLAVLIERFLGEYKRPRIKDLTRYRAFAGAALRRVLPMLGHKRADTLTTSEIGALRDALSETLSAGSVRATLAYLSSALSWAVRAGLLATNPCKGVERPESEPSLDFLSRAEVSALLAHTREHAGNAHPMIATALYTGLRKGELCGLRWRDLDLQSRRLTVARSYRTSPKSGKPRHLRLPDVLVPVLADWHERCPKTQEELVFPARLRDGSWGMQRDTSSVFGLPGLLRAAGCRVPAHPWHALRHTFASHFIMAGGNILTLQKILGHSDVKVTLIYAHLAPDFIAEEMNRLRF